MYQRMLIQTRGTIPYNRNYTSQYASKHEQLYKNYFAKK